MTAVLGGGLSGLSAGYCALINPKIRSVVVLIEATNRLGGWVRSERSPSGEVFEKGPRKVGVGHPKAYGSLLLVDQLKLWDQILPFSVLHPATRKELIFVKDMMVSESRGFDALFETNPPFSKPFYKILLSEMFKPSVKVEDESVYSFIERRLGTEYADYRSSPSIVGRCAGDAKQLSAKAYETKWFEMEQKHGSIVKGLLKEKFFGKNENKYISPKVLKIVAQIMNSDVFIRALEKRWCMWTMKDGFEILPKTLGTEIQKLGADVRLKTVCEKLNFKNDGVEVLMNGKKEYFENVISSLPAWDLAKLVKSQHPKLAEELGAIPAVDVGVVNLEFKERLSIPVAFGFEVAPIEKRPILMVFFDSMYKYPYISMYRNRTNTCLTVLMGGAWYDKYFKNAKEEDLLSVAISQVKEILKIKSNPVSYHVSVRKKSIPQYIIGHNARIERIKYYICANKLPLHLCGASYGGGLSIENLIGSGINASREING